MTLPRLASVALVWAAGAAEAQTQPQPQLVDHIVVDKSDRTLTVYMSGEPVRVITGIQLGDVPEGAKRFQGDERTPEGRYIIDYGNPRSSYHLSLHISYPNAADEALARSYGRSAGGAIFIHGQPNGVAMRLQGDWTDGCIAVGNDEIEALWQSVPDGTTIDILP
ncbi:MAG TPA: L,D-transpeptidase family protein [Novosphingobium sp.]|nr:L,D-transpeptidase family protein [Novosphingobium sp.]